MRMRNSSEVHSAVGNPVTQQSDVTRSAFKARSDHREYNVYVDTAAVERAWPRIPEWPLSPQMGPLLVSLEIALKVLDDTLDEIGSRVYVNDSAKTEVVAESVGSLLTLIADIAFTNRSASSAPEVLFGSRSSASAWNSVMAKLDRAGDRIAKRLRSRHDLAVGALGFDLGLAGTPGLRCFA